MKLIMFVLWSTAAREISKDPILRLMLMMYEVKRFFPIRFNRIIRLNCRQLFDKKMKNGKGDLQLCFDDISFCLVYSGS